MGVLTISLTLAGLLAVGAGLTGTLGPIVGFIVDLLDLGKHLRGEPAPTPTKIQTINDGGTALSTAIIAAIALDQSFQNSRPDDVSHNLHSHGPDLKSDLGGGRDNDFEVPDLDPGHDW